MLRRLARKHRGDSSDAMPLDDEHQVDEHAMPHSMIGEDDRKPRRESAVGECGRHDHADFDQNETSAAGQQPDIGDDGCNDDSPVLNSIRVQVIAPEKRHPLGYNSRKHELVRQDQPPLATNEGHVKARQKLDSLARQHQRHQRQKNNSSSRGGYFASTAFTVTTNITPSEGDTTVTADSSDTPMHNRHHKQQQLLYNCKSIVPPSTLTRHIASCVEEAANHICNNGESSLLSLESSYYSKHDFRNLPRGASPTEHTDAFTLKTDNDVTSRENNCQSEGGNEHNENWNISSTALAPPQLVRYHDHFYQPTPPQKRSGGAPATSAWEKRRSRPSQQKQQQTHMNQSEKYVTLVSRPVIDMQVELINDGIDAEGEHVVVTPNPKTLNLGTIFASPAEDAPSTSAPLVAMAVTPSPPPKSLQQKKMQHRPLIEPQQEEEPQQQPQQRSETQAASTAQTAKIANTSHMFIRLLKRHQMTKSPRKKEHQGNQSWQEEETKNQQQQGRQQPQQLQQLGKSTLLDPEESSDEIIRPVPPRHQPRPTPTKEVKGGEPPDDLQDSQQLRRRPDPPRDPPAEYRHYSSKVIDSFPPQKSSQFTPPRQPKSSNMQAESTSYPSKKNSTSQQHNIHDSKPRVLQPPSQMKRQIMSEQERHHTEKEWTMPLPLVKENSKISNFSSGFYTVQTTNTISSKFWDEVEDFSDPNGTSKKYETNNAAAKKNIANGIHSTDVKIDQSSAEDASNDQRTTAPLHQSVVSDQPQSRNHKVNAYAKTSTKKSRISSLATIYDDDSYSNAFSLKLPIINGGGFDDSDISALQMNDSATVYFQQQLDRTHVDAASGYWKKKHERIKNALEPKNSIDKKEKEQHRRQHKQGELQYKQLELKKTNHNNQKAIQRVATSTPITLDTAQRNRCASPFDAFNQLYELGLGMGVIKLDNCDSKQPHQNNNGTKKGWDGEVSVHTMKTAAEEMVNFVEKIEEKNAIQELQNSMRSNVLLPMPSAVDETDLRHIGLVPLDEEQQHEERNDVTLLIQWDGVVRKNRNVRSSKSLADDLTAGASRLSRGIGSKLPSFTVDGEQSELSENAHRISATAIKKDMYTLRAPRSSSRSPNRSTGVCESETNGSNKSVGRSKISIAGASNFGSNIPSDYANWFELPSPGITCIPLLPLFDVSLRNSIDLDISPLSRVNDTIDLAFAFYLSRASQGLAVNEIDVNIVKLSIGAIVADEDNGSIRFVNASTNLRGISDAAVAAISRGDFQDATEIYNTLLSSCQTSTGSKLGLVGQLVASTLHNLSILHLWNQEYDQALPYCRESLRIKTELVGDSVNSWANLGFIYFAIGSATSALASFCKAVQMSSEFYPEGHVTGKLVNNMACVNFEIGKMPLVQSQFKQSIQLQRGGCDDSSLDDIALSSEDDLFSISIAIFNMGVTCTRQNQYDAAISQLQQCYAIQEAILEHTNEIVQSTAYYLDSLRLLALTSAAETSNNDLEANQPETTEKHNVLQHDPRILKSRPDFRNDRRGNAEPQIVTNPIIKHGGLSNDSKSTSLTRLGPDSGQRKQISYPMICLGNLRVESTISERIHQSLEGYSDSLALQSVSGVRELSMLCRRPAISSKKKTMSLSQNIIHYGVLTIKKREAQSELYRSLEKYGPRHPDVGKCYHSLGLLYLFSEAKKSKAEAITYLENSIRIYTNAMGVKHPDVASTLMLKGLAQLALERFDDSIASMLRVRRMREDTLGHRHPELGQILNNLACVQYELGDYRKAESLFQEALDLQREAFTTEPAFLNGVSKVLCNSAFLHAKSGSFPKALIELEGALQIKKDILFEDNSLDDIIYSIAHILAVQKLQHGVFNLEEITEEYITMLRTSTIR